MREREVKQSWKSGWEAEEEEEEERKRERSMNTPLHHDNSHLVSAHSSSVLESPLCCSNQLPEPGARPHDHCPAPYWESDDLNWVDVVEYCPGSPSVAVWQD